VVGELLSRSLIPEKSVLITEYRLLIAFLLSTFHCLTPP
jgi:hypothetical protein